jgi:Flp pilus assembly protein TadG
MMLSRLRSFYCRLRGDDRGVAFVEFGFLVPILSVLVIAVIDLSQGLSQRFTMQQAVNRSLERLLVSRPVAGANDSSVDYTYIRQEAATAAGVPLSQVTLSQYLLCNGTQAASSATACPQGQEQARYISLTVNKNFTGSFYLGTVPLSVTGSMRVQ